MMWVFLKFFVEEHDNGIDLLTKFQPNPIWHSRDIIKTPVLQTGAANSLFCIVVGYSPCLEVSTYQGGFK
jgi:hypothetical protein